MFYILVSVLVTLVSIYMFANRVYRSRNSLSNCHRFPLGTHVVISGGSKGIGKALAIKFAELGTHVTIIARNETDLALAKTDIDSRRKNIHVQKIRTVSLDITKITFPDNTNSDKTREQRELLEKILGEHDRCDILINCCGSAIAARFDDTSQQQFRHMMEVNYFSAVNLTRTLLPLMKSRNLVSSNGSKSNGGRVVFVSSICGLLSFFGYTAYSASKFALVGLAEALHMELKPFDIGVTIAFPPDTDTPGYAEENKTKPSLTLKISETGNICNAETVAHSIVADILAKNFYSTVGIENLMVLSATNSFMPSNSYWKIFVDSLIAGPLKLVAFFLLRSWYKLVDEATPNEIIKAEIALKCSKNSK